MEKKALVINPRAVYMCNPAFGGEVDDEGWYGHVVTVLSQPAEDWYQIRTPYDYETYACGKDLLFDQGEVARAEAAKLSRIWHPAADVQTKSDCTSGVLITLFRGAVVEPIQPEEGEEVKPGWTKVRLFGGQTGFVRDHFLGEYFKERALGEEELRESVVKLALSYLGVQYRWGGKTPEGIDCSGLVGAAYLMYGVKLYRNASIAQGFAAHSIQRENMKKGDLLFFKGHVAMYIGEGRYVHSTSRIGADGVVINSLCPGDALYRADLANGVLDVGSVF